MIIFASIVVFKGWKVIIIHQFNSPIMGIYISVYLTGSSWYQQFSKRISKQPRYIAVIGCESSIVWVTVPETSKVLSNTLTAIELNWMNFMLHADQQSQNHIISKVYPKAVLQLISLLNWTPASFFAVSCWTLLVASTYYTTFCWYIVCTMAIQIGNYLVVKKVRVLEIYYICINIILVYKAI